MDRIFTPWRSEYVTGARPPAGCLFCAARASADDRAVLVVARWPAGFVMLNAYPYTAGHVMVVPDVHAAWPSDLPPAVLADVGSKVAVAERVLRDVYRPDGLNVGMNLGADAGAGVPGHLHVHVVPRWRSDTNFMTVLDETRVIPEDLATTHARLQPAFAAALADAPS
jgi:ATP adenylyltransferase